jgi:hypothetical protein
MMMREFEVLIWASLNSKEQLEEEGVLKEGEKESPQKKILYRLLMTAFYLKERYCKKNEYTTEWLLLAEPDLSFLTPRVMNKKYMEL